MGAFTVTRGDTARGEGAVQPGTSGVVEGWANHEMATAIYYTPRDLARHAGCCDKTARRALRHAAHLTGSAHEPGQWWRFDLGNALDRATVEAAKWKLQSGRHSIRGHRHYSARA